MKTIFIGREEVHAYLADLAHRLEPVPSLWCPITHSGREIAVHIAQEVEKVAKAKGESVPNVRILPIEIDDQHQPVFEERPEDVIPYQSVLLLDGAIHSGMTMARCAAAVLKHRPSSVASYSVVLKRRSVFIPTLWGVMTDETDRAHFLLNKIPNNRLNAGAKSSQPHVHLRRLDESRSKAPTIKCDVPSIDRVTWGDRLWEMATSDGATTTYLLERSETVVGFLTLHVEDRGAARVMTVLEVAVDPSEKDKGYGGLLLRFADTMARQAECDAVRLNAIEEKVPMYEKFGYHRVAGSLVLPLEDERYYPMERRVLYHHPDLRG